MYICICNAITDKEIESLAQNLTLNKKCLQKIENLNDKMDCNKQITKNEKEILAKVSNELEIDFACCSCWTQIINLRKEKI